MEKPRQVSSPGPFVSIDEQVSAVAYMPIVTHATARRHVRMLGLILRRVRDHHFRGEQQTGHRSSVLQRQARDLGRVQDALFEHVAVLAVGGL